MLSELIKYLDDALGEYGDMNVCVYSDCFYAPSEAIVLTLRENRGYFNICEEQVVGDFLLIE